MLPWGLWRTPQFFFFFDPKTTLRWPPKVWYFWKIPQSLLVIFSSFLFLRKGQERTENTKKFKFGFENLKKIIFKFQKRVKN